ncbi:hypothetical protein P692DRAFT_20839759 [Suillus brevipes Sb2]|nr:hypothetical protein P692DRAFT_20839759 [Suillus brevipes Sb2]
MKTHGLNALRIASVLTSYPAVEHIVYPGFATHHRTYLPQPTHKSVSQHHVAVGPCAWFTLQRDGLVPQMW